MKMTNRLIILTAMFLALASCSKEVSEADAPAVSSEGGEREIALAFSGSTKATLDGLTPIFAAGDKILLSNNSATETCTVKTRNGKAFIITHLTGPLTMVFPSTAVILNGNQITGVKVPSSQDGLFSSAVISMAENITGNHATFDCKVPILKFYADASIGVNQINVQGTDVASNGNTILVWVSQYTIRSNPDPRICYIAVRPGINANTLTFTSTTSTQGAVEKQCTTNAVLQAGHTYNAFIPYYIDLGTAGKWGYCNVGAFLPEESGYYFFWGGTVGYKRSGSNWVKASDNTVSSGGFCIENAPHHSGSAYTKYTGTGDGKDGKTVLELADDAAYANWGYDWRMPTREEFDGIISLKQGDFASGYHFGGSSESKQIFIPAAGSGSGTEFGNNGTSGLYWSSSLNTSNSEKACYFGITNLSQLSPASTWNIGRSYGLSIRPIYNGKGVNIEGYDDEGEF